MEMWDSMCKLKDFKTAGTEQKAGVSPAGCGALCICAGCTARRPAQGHSKRCFPEAVKKLVFP